MKLKALRETSRFSSPALTDEQGFTRLKNHMDHLVYTKNLLDKLYRKLTTKLKDAPLLGNEKLMNRIKKINDERGSVNARIVTFADKIENNDYPGSKIKVIGRKGFVNPYFECETSHYAGSIFNAPFVHSMPSKSTIEMVLRRNGISPFTKVYGGYNGGAVNFAALTDDGRVVWRNRDVSNSGAKIKSIYIDNKKYSQNEFLNASPAHQSSMLAPLKSPPKVK